MLGPSIHMQTLVLLCETSKANEGREQRTIEAGHVEGDRTHHQYSSSIPSTCRLAKHDWREKCREHRVDGRLNARAQKSGMGILC